MREFFNTDSTSHLRIPPPNNYLEDGGKACAVTDLCSSSHLNNLRASDTGSEDAVSEVFWMPFSFSDG